MAQTSDPQAARLAEVERIWDGWLAAQGGPDAVMVVLHDGAQVAAFERGIDADTPVPLASGSKAITALCVEALVAEGALRMDTNIRTLLDAGWRGLTVEEALTHTGGLYPDSTQSSMAGWRGVAAPRWAAVTNRALRRLWQSGARGHHAYNNENYAILGQTIEAVTGAAYADACASRVLQPLGIRSADTKGRFGAYAPWGGWRMAPRDYARFHHAGFVGRDVFAGPHAEVQPDVYYGLGMMTGVLPNGQAVHFHAGRLCFGDADDHGSYTVSYGLRWSLFLAYDACILDAPLGALETAVIEALFSQP